MCLVYQTVIAEKNVEFKKIIGKLSIKLDFFSILKEK